MLRSLPWCETANSAWMNSWAHRDDVTRRYTIRRCVATRCINYESAFFTTFFFSAGVAIQRAETIRVIPRATYAKPTERMKCGGEEERVTRAVDTAGESVIYMRSRRPMTRKDYALGRARVVRLGTRARVHTQRNFLRCLMTHNLWLDCVYVAL